MQTFKLLIEDYERRLKTAEDYLNTHTSNGSEHDIKKFERLTTKASEYRTVIAELKRTVFDDSHCKTVVEVINLLPQQPQVQYDLTKQLQELRIAANKLGLYDAADFLRPKGE